MHALSNWRFWLAAALAFAVGWKAYAGGAVIPPGGANGSVQTNSSGSFGGITEVDGDCVVGAAGAWGAGSCGGASSFPSLAYVSGNWYVPWAPYSTGSGGAVTSGTIYCFPAMMLNKATIDKLGTHITTVGTSNVQMAIYNNTTSGRPGTLIAATASVVNTSTGEVNAALSSNQQLQAQTMYWWCSQTNDSAAIYNSVAAITLPNPWGGAAWMGSATQANVALGNVSINGLAITGNAFGSWPNLTTATFVDNTGNTMPVVKFHLTSVP